MGLHLKEAFKYKPKFDFKLDTRNSFITNEAVRIFGIKAGLNFYLSRGTYLGKYRRHIFAIAFRLELRRIFYYLVSLKNY